MIKYTVRCKKDHEFEGWFKDSATFDEQARASGIACPYCGSSKVSKAPMAPRISKSAGSTSLTETRAREVAREVAKAAMAIRSEVEKNCDYVGTQFAEEARRIHYGETEERGIYGEASADETKELLEEGVDVLPLPPVRRDA